MNPESAGFRGVAIAVLVLVALVSQAWSQGEAEGRAERTQIVVGLTPNTGYELTVEGEEIAGSPSASDEDGFLVFEFDDAGQPAGPLSVCIVTDGSLVIYDVELTLVTDTSAVIGWRTNHPADSQVEYGLTPAYGLSTPTDPSLVLEHSATLQDLESGTLYHFRILASDAQGAGALSADRTFETVAVTLALDEVTVAEIGPTWAVVAWESERPASSQVEYGLTEAYGSVTPLDDDLVSDHEVLLSGLTENTLYHYRVTSIDGNGVGAISADGTFTTLDIDVTGPPAIGGVSTEEVAATAMRVSWLTDRPATSLVRYGLGDALDLSTPHDTTAVYVHSVLVSPVIPLAEYSFVVESTSGDYTTVHEVGTFETVAPNGFTPDVLDVEALRPTAVEVDAAGARLVWETSSPGITWVEYGQDTSYGATAPGIPIGRGTCEALLDGLLTGTTYHCRVIAENWSGGFSASPDSVFATLGELPSLRFFAYPNPVVESTTFMFEVRPGDGRSRVRVLAPDGRVVRELTNAVFDPGDRTVMWDGTDAAGNLVASGVYLAEFSTHSTTARRKLTVVR
jgi:hypothetical protein